MSKIASNERILKVREFDLNYLELSDGTYYVCTDTNNVYRDSDSNRDQINVILLNTDRDRDDIRPVNGGLYYIWETNELWIFSGNRWDIKIESDKRNSYLYRDGTLDNESGSTVIDNNGLLGDGSVVIRDENRVVRCIIKVDTDTNDIIISSFLGNGIKILPNGNEKALGALLINPNKIYKLVEISTGNYVSYDEAINSTQDYIAYLENFLDNAVEGDTTDTGMSISQVKQILESDTSNQEVFSMLFRREFDTKSDGYSEYRGNLNITEDAYKKEETPDGDNYYKYIHENDLLDIFNESDDGSYDSIRSALNNYIQRYIDSTNNR